MSVSITDIVSVYWAFTSFVLAQYVGPINYNGMWSMVYTTALSKISKNIYRSNVQVSFEIYAH